MMVNKLTPAAARAAAPGDVLHDHEVAGLRLRCTHTRKSWYLYYRTRASDQRQPKIGDFPEVSINRAREIARSIKDQVAAGADPGAAWKDRRDAPTVADLCSRYLTEYAAINKAASSVDQDKRLIYTHVLPGLGKMRVVDVRRADIDTFLTDVAARRFVRPSKRHPGKAAPGAANRCRALLSTMFALALDKDGFDMRPEALGNPVKRAVRQYLPSRRRIATPRELRRIAVELRTLFETKPRHAAALVTLFVTGARVGEIEYARLQQWSRDAITLTEHKTFRTIGAKVIPLPPIASRLIEIVSPKDAPPETRLFGNISLRGVWETLRKVSGCPDLQLRDLRRTFASYALSDGVGLGQIGDLFGHTSTQTTRGYAQLTPTARRKVTQQGADALGVAAGGVFGRAGPRMPRKRVARVWRR
jgi:integrase